MKLPWTIGRNARRQSIDPVPASERRPGRLLWRRSALAAVPLAGVLVLGVGGSAFASSPAPATVVHAHLVSDQTGAAVVPLHTQGANIVDADGKTVTITGVNWFGFETGTFAPDGLWARSYTSMLDQIVASGFNAIRLPYSNALFRPGNTPNGINYQLNPDLKGLSGLALMDKIVNAATSRGLMIILDQHRPDQNAQSPLPASGDLTEQQWISDWVMLAQHYRSNPLVIGADLHNEPNGPATWGTGNPQTDWRLMAEQAGDAVLAAAPHWLIFVEGIDNYNGQGYWWGGDLAGAKRYPVVLSEPDHLVYEAHDYGPDVYNQNWFLAKNFPNNLPAIWEQNWAYLKTQNIAPVLLGEFGGSVGNDAEGEWQRTLVAFLKQHDISYTYWCWNPNSGDTGGVLGNDWQTVDQDKLNLLHTYQYPLPQIREVANRNPGQAGTRGSD
jgi:endoglucanase